MTVNTQIVLSRYLTAQKLNCNFVIELRSESDRLKTLQAKMEEYLYNGLRLGWLINPQDGEVETYRLQQPVEVVKIPCLLSGENVLPNFELEIDF